MTVPARRDQTQSKSLSDIFNQFAQDSTELFPALKGKFLIHDTNQKANYGRDALDLEKAGYTPALVDSFLKRRAKHRKCGTHAEWGNKLNISFILYSERVPVRARKAVPEQLEKDILFILDHELAHLAIKDPALEGENKQYKDSLKEAIADAYALIRHYQRFGTESDHQSVMIDPWARASALMLNRDTVHFSSFMLEKIISRKDTIDFASLTSQQTAELAKRFAVEYTPPSSTVNRVLAKLKPAQEAYVAAPKSNLWLKVLAQIALDPATDSYTFKVCKKILRGYLDGRKDMEGRSIRTKGAGWDNIRRKLRAAEVRHAKEDILFNIPLMKDKPKRSYGPQV